MSGEPLELKEAHEELQRHGIALDLKAFSKAHPKGVEGLKAVDLTLAFCCARRDPKALAYFEATYFPQAVRALKKMKLSTTLADDVLSWMRFELFAREKNGPLIGTYSGRGDLGAWVRSIAVHEALKRTKKQRRDVTPEAAADLPMPGPELASMRGAYGAQFTRALADSFAELETGQRNLLRQYFLDGLSIDVLAKLLQVHRATAARRVQSAREELVDRVKARLTDELKLSSAGVAEVITLSNLDESLSGLLRKTRR